MIFKNIDLEIGDYIFLRSSTVSLPFKAAVISIKDKTMKVISAEFIISQQYDHFTEKDILEIKIVRKASEAIPLESWTKKFTKNEEVFWEVGDTIQKGRVVAAFNRLVVVISNGKFATGLAINFHSRKRAISESVVNSEGELIINGTSDLNRQ